MRTIPRGVTVLLACPAVMLLLGANPYAQVSAGAPAGTPASQQRAARLQKERTNIELQQSVPPFKMFDNLYYVGVGFVSSWLLTTDQGLILIDTLDEVHADHLLDNIRKVGFDPKDIKYVLITHAHADHVGAVARIQETYGAKVVMAEGDFNLFNGIGGAKPEATRAPRRDIIATDGDTVTLGKTAVRLALHPGHTPGGLSTGFTVYDGGKPYEAYIFAGANPGQGLPAVEQFVASVDRLERMAQRVQVRVVSHPFMDPTFWERVDRLAARRPGDRHPFVVMTEFAAWIAQLKQVGIKRLADANAKAGSAN